MDKLVSRVTLVEGSGSGRKTETVFSGAEEEYPTIPIDSIVRSVTVLEGARGSRTATVVFRSRTWEEREPPRRRSAGDLLKRLLKADMIRAQDTYLRHLEAKGDDKRLWWLDLPATMIRAFIKAGESDPEEKPAEGEGAKDAEADMRDLREDLKAAGADIKGGSDAEPAGTAPAKEDRA